MLLKQLCIVILFIHLFSNVLSFGFTLPALELGDIGAGIGAGLYMAKCLVTECCSDKYLVGDLKQLQVSLDKALYGQKLARDVVLSAIRAHWNSPHSQKALTMSFHGSPGTGKNYVSQMIVDNLFKEGAKSKYVHHFNGRIHFPKEADADKYRENIYHWIKGNISECETQLFIFDEVDKIPPSVLNGIKPIIDYHDTVEKLSYRKSIFIFLSNTGSATINEHYLKLWKSGVKRDEIKLKDFEKLIAEGAFNEKGIGSSLAEALWKMLPHWKIFTWLCNQFHTKFLHRITRPTLSKIIYHDYVCGFHHSDTIKSNLIDHYIPFLPLEADHVRSCIYTEFMKRGIKNLQESDIMDVFENVEFGPPPDNLFAKTGCKRLSQKVGMAEMMQFAKPLEEL